MALKKIDIDKLIESYLEMASSDPAVLDEMLLENGYKPEDVERKGRQLIKSFLFQLEVNQKKVKLENLYIKAASLLQSATVTSKEAIFNLLRQKSPSLQFRNLDKLDIENLQQILDETEILEIIEKMEKGDL